MQLKPSFTLLDCEQIYGLEVTQLDSKFITYFFPTCGTASSPEKPQGRIHIAI